MDDLISRSALLERLDKVAMPDDLYSLGIQRGVEHAKEMIAEAPAVDAETVCKQMGLVKEALEMEKANLVPVVRCKDCKRCRGFGGVTIEPDEVGICKIDDFCVKPNDFCSYGERRSDK